MNPPAIDSSNIIPTGIIFSAIDTRSSGSGNRRLPALSGVSNNALFPEPGPTYLDSMPGEILQLIAQFTPLNDREPLAAALTRGKDQGTYIDKEVELSEFIIKRVPKISTIDDFRTALRDIHCLLRSDQARSLEALSGTILNFTDQPIRQVAIKEFIKEARPRSDRHPSLRELVNAIEDVNDIHQLFENVSRFIFQQFKSENNCLKIADRYGITKESILHKLEHYCLEQLSNEELEKSKTPGYIAAKYGIYKPCVLDKLEYKFVEYHAGVDIFNGDNAKKVAARYNITSLLGRKRLYEYQVITKKIMAGGNCFLISQKYSVNLLNKQSRVAMEELSIKHLAGPAVLAGKKCPGVARKYGIVTTSGRKKLDEYIPSNRTTGQDRYDSATIEKKRRAIRHNPRQAKKLF